MYEKYLMIFLSKKTASIDQLIGIFMHNVQRTFSYIFRSFLSIFQYTYFLYEDSRPVLRSVFRPASRNQTGKVEFTFVFSPTGFNATSRQAGRMIVHDFRRQGLPVPTNLGSWLLLLFKHMWHCIVPLCSVTSWTHPEIIPVGQFFWRWILVVGPFSWLIDWR